MSLGLMPAVLMMSGKPSTIAGRCEKEVFENGRFPSEQLFGSSHVELPACWVGILGGVS